MPRVRSATTKRNIRRRKLKSARRKLAKKKTRAIAKGAAARK